MKTENQRNPSREDIDTGRLFAEMLKFFAETQKLNAETKWYPVRYLGGVFIAAVVFLGTVIALVKAFL